jgi:Domain of unknown function (DUF4281)
MFFSVFSKMNTADFFTYASIAMFIPWGTMICFPRGRYTEQVVSVAILLFILAAICVIWKNINTGRQEGDFLSLEGLTRFFQNQDLMLAGWLNYLAFSLCAGIWQINDAREIKLAHLLVVPGLLLTLLAGPVGLLVYFLIRRIKTGNWQVR